MALSAVFLLSPNCLTHMESPINPETPQKPLHQPPNQNSTHRYLSSGQRREFLQWGKGERDTREEEKERQDAQAYSTRWSNIPGGLPVRYLVGPTA